MGKKKKNKNKKVLSLAFSIPAFIIIWFAFLLFGMIFYSVISVLIIRPDALTLFMLPIAGAGLCIIGVVMLTLASEISKGIKRLRKEKNGKKKK